MNRPRFLVVAMMVASAVVGGALVATLVPTLSTAAPSGAPGASLDLVQSPPSAATVTAPSFADLAEKAIPSVVSITSSRMVEAKDPHDFLFDNPFFKRFFQGDPDEQRTPPGERKRSQKQKKQWGGSGFFITRDGFILTNKHVVEDAETLYVRTSDMAQQDEGIKARLIGTDPYLDLAMIKVDGRSDWQALALGDSDKLRVGEWVVAIGNPIIFRNSVTVGVVSGKGRRIDFDPSNIGDYIQTDAAINFGNSGGPLLNARGEVVGINSAIIRDDPSGNGLGGNGYIQGVGFALPISPVRKVVAQLAGTGTVKRGYLGVSVQAMDPEKAEYLGAPKNRGAYVARVDKGTPAYQAGIRADDIILSVDGSPVSSSEELVNAISSHAPGDKVRIQVWRDKKQVELTASLAERTVGKEQEPEHTTDTSGDEEGASALGFSVRPLPQGARDRMKQGDQPLAGVIVSDVDPASNAANRGMVEGLVLVDLNGVATPSVDAYRKAAGAIKPGQIVRARVLDPRTGDEATVFFRAPEKK